MSKLESTTDHFPASTAGNNDSAKDATTGETIVDAAPAPRLRRNRLYLWAAGLLAVLLIAGGLIWWNIPPELHGVVLQSPRQAEDFTLTASTGEPLSLSDLQGQWVMLYFGYTYCPDVCPTTLNDLSIMAGELGDNRMEDVQVVMVSVDPEQDTAARLANYLPNFDPEFVGMTGEMDEVQDVAGRFSVFFEKNDQGLVDHTSAVTVIDPEGYVRIVFPYGVTGQEMADDLTYFLRRG